MSEYSEYKGLVITVADGIATVVLQYQTEGIENAAEIRRHQQMELRRCWREFDSDPDIRVVLLTGVGGKEFYLSGRPPGSAPKHGDIDAMWQFTLFFETELERVFRDMVNFSKPVICAVNGAAAGGGQAVVMLSDITIMAEDAWLFDPHIMLGVSAGDGPGGLWPLYTGIAKAKLYLLTSDAINGIEAERTGLVGRAVPRAQLMDVANDYAQRLAAAPPVALRFTKRTINQWFRLAELVSQNYAHALESVSEYSGEREGNPHIEYPPRQVP